jgi:hypothetical protein
MMQEIAKILITFGVIFIITGGILTLFSKFPIFGQLPGDIIIKRNSFTFYFPLASSIIISLLLTLILNLIFRK